MSDEAHANSLPGDHATGAGRRRVRAGECLFTIAVEQGFHWKTLWDHADNAELKKHRHDPMVLRPDDAVTIPEKRIRQETCAHEKKHTFQRKGIPPKARLRLLEEGEPRANLSCEIVIDEITITRATDGDGLLEFPIPVGAREAVITAGEGEDAVVYRCRFGHLDPHDSIRGVQQRLCNLGFYIGPLDGEPSEELNAAVKTFQETNGLNPDGGLSKTIREAIQEAHGS